MLKEAFHMEDTIYITGHKNPDTDSICSAIAYADLKNKLGHTSAKAIRLGSVSKETQFALDHFKVKAPDLMESMKAQIADLNFGPKEVLLPSDTIKKAWDLIKDSDSKTLSVVDDEGKLIGIASQSTITSSYMDIWDNAAIQKSNTKVASIIETLSAKPVYLVDDGADLKGKIVVSAMLPDSSEPFIEQGDIVICGDRIDSQEMIIRNKAALMVVTGNLPVSKEIVEKAKAADCSIISTPYDTFTASRLVPLSVPVGYVMSTEKLISFRLDDTIDDVRDVMLDTRYRSYPVLDSENKVVGNISRYHLIAPNKKKLILVDHNEKGQSVNGREDADILEIIDHHRIADIMTTNPILYRCEPVGCTATIVTNMFYENGLEPSKEIAGLLCSAIISDTLLFKSPTSTAADKAAVEKLAAIAGIDPVKYAKDMFKAGSSLAGKSAEDLFNQDFKEFTLGDLKLGVSQISTMDVEGLNPVKPDLISLMQNKAKGENFHLLILMLTDILEGGSELVVIGDRKDLAEKAFDVKIPGDTVYVPGMMSRKKQVIPPLTAASL
jgi:manganese-dependent inorganic pyrophosphatase